MALAAPNSARAFQKQERKPGQPGNALSLSTSTKMPRRANVPKFAQVRIASVGPSRGSFPRRGFHL
eukprot:11213069-Lingulodinium_polyedra.AAC.1